MSSARVKNIKNERNLTFGTESSDFSQVSEQGSKDIEEQDRQQEDQEYGWKSFHKSKTELQKIKLQLYSAYIYHRKNLCDTVKEFCIQSNNQSFNYAALMNQQSELLKRQATTLSEPKLSSFQQKVAVVQKLISERRIKRYYKNKHEINYQDELDPEDDEKQIYKIYQEAFLRNREGGRIEQAYSKPQLTNVEYYQPSNIQVRPLPSIIDMSAKNSFQHIQSQAILSPYKQKVNYLKVNDPFVGFQPQLSFEQRNDHYVAINNQFMDSFAINPADKHDAISEGGRQKSKLQKEDDQLSHKDNIYKNFIEKQNQQLQKQKMRVQQLTDKAFKVLNSGEIEEQDEKLQQPNEQQDKLAQFKYMLGEIIQTFSVAQSLKFLLKFKSFELLNKLYEHASEYFREQIEFEQPIKASHMLQIVQSTMPQQQQSGIKIVIENLFQGKQQISYEQFLQKLTPNINQLEYKTIEQSSVSSHNHKSLDLTVRLFSVWIQLDYFQKQIKKLLEHSPNIVQKFIAQVVQNSILSIVKVCDFITRSKKNKVKKLKTEIFFRHITGMKLNLSEFYRWINTRKMEQSPYINKQAAELKYQYYYNLY